MSPAKRYLLRNLTILCPWLDWLWHGETLRSGFTLAGHKVEIHQREGSAGPYELVIVGKPLTWEELVGPPSELLGPGRLRPYVISRWIVPELIVRSPNACFAKHIGEATDAAAYYIRELNAGRQNRK